LEKGYFFYQEEKGRRKGRRKKKESRRRNAVGWVRFSAVARSVAFTDLELEGGFRTVGFCQRWLVCASRLSYRPGQGSGIHTACQPPPAPAPKPCQGKLSDRPEECRGPSQQTSGTGRQVSLLGSSGTI